MAYTKTTWQDGVTPLSAANMNKIEDALEAPGGINQDAWMYTIFKNQLTTQEKLDIESNPTLMSIVNGTSIPRTNDSYLAWVINANSGSLDASFGKDNNESFTAIGEQLVRYSKYKGEGLAFTKLQKMNTFIDCLYDVDAIIEIENSPQIMSLIALSPYAKSQLDSAWSSNILMGKYTAKILGKSNYNDYATFDDLVVESQETRDLILAKKRIMDKLDLSDNLSAKLLVANVGLSPTGYNSLTNIATSDPTTLASIMTSDKNLRVFAVHLNMADRIHGVNLQNLKASIHSVLNASDLFTKTVETGTIYSSQARPNTACVYTKVSGTTSNNANIYYYPMDAVISSYNTTVTGSLGVSFGGTRYVQSNVYRGNADIFTAKVIPS